MKLVLLGPPGSGKGTQAKIVAERLAIPHISTGDILREAVRTETALGKQAAPIMAIGGLVPDDLMIGIIRERLTREDARGGFILDGFPRTVPQAEKLEEVVAGNGKRNLRVIQLLVPDDVIVRRVASRRSCPKCGAVYSLESAPPKRDEVCDRDETPLVVRPDDREEAVRRRLDEFHRQTVPVVTFYRQKSVLREVDGIGPVDLVFERIERSLG